MKAFSPNRRPVFGIITPSHNRPDLLVRLHRSLHNTAGDTDWKHFVVDDGSSVSYTQCINSCSSKSGNFYYSKIPNSGPLIARNVAIDAALTAGCDFLCFFDDDDAIAPPGLPAIERRIFEYSSANWFIFKKLTNPKLVSEKSLEPISVDWFRDAILSRTIESDSLCVISSVMIGQTRFSTRGRNQREWTFFLDLHEKHPKIILCPEALRNSSYLTGGLSEIALKREMSIEQIKNSIERAYRYWKQYPSHPALIKQLLWQTISAPPKIALGLMKSLRIKDK